MGDGNEAFQISETTKQEATKCLSNFAEGVVLCCSHQL